MELLWGVLVVLVLLVAVLLYRRARAARQKLTDGFASPKARQVTHEAKKVFEARGGNPSYRDYCNAVTDADPVQFTRVRKLARSGALTAENVERFL